MSRSRRSRMAAEKRRQAQQKLAAERKFARRNRLPTDSEGRILREKYQPRKDSNYDPSSDQPFRPDQPTYQSVTSKDLGKTSDNRNSTARKPKAVYDGERRLLGIAAMHKSNLVPVFDEQDAKDIARMRRG